MDEKPEKLATEKEAVHKEAMDRFEEVFNAEKDQREQSVKEGLFIHETDGQWEEDAKTKRADRPRYTIDRVSGALDQVNGDQRQNRTQIKVTPYDGGNKDIAKIHQGLIRSIENQSDANSIYDNAFDEEITGGRGGWRVLTKFSDDDTFKQEILIDPIRSAATTLYLDPSAKKFDKRDAMWGFVVEDMTLNKFKVNYPNASATDFNFDDMGASNCRLWFRENMIKVGEYWRVKVTDTEIALMSNGKVYDLIEEKSVIDELAEKGITILKTRKTQRRNVESFLLNGSEVLKGPMKWAGKYIPLIEVVGRTANVEGKSFVRGMVRKAKDAQRIYNYSTSNAIETTALSPKDPYWLTAKQAVGHEPRLRTINTLNSPFQLYNADPDSPGPPQRTGAPALQQSLIQQQGQASLDVYATTGIQPPSLGINPEMQSGKAVIAQQKMGDRGTFVFSDNLNKGIKFTGDILVDLMPRIFDTEQTVKLLNFDGTTEEVKINAAELDEFNLTIVDDETGEKVIVNDLSQGKYQTNVESGPAYSTQRQESADQLIQLATGSDVFAALASDLIAKNINILESEELVERVRAQMIKQGLVQPTEEEIERLGLNQEQPPSEEQVALIENIRMQTAKMMADIENTNADTDNKDAKTLETKLKAQQDAIETYDKLMDAYKKQSELGIDFGIDEHTIRKAQQGIIELSQEELIVNNA